MNYPLPLSPIHDTLTEMTVDHASLEPGQTISNRRYTLDDAAVALYVNAVGDRSGLYREGDGVTPPMAVAALGLRGVVEDLHIPGGTLHTSQEMEFLVAVPVGSELRCEADVLQNSVRGGRRFLVVDIRMDDGDGRRVLTARARWCCQRERRETLREGDPLPTVEREIDQTRIALYAEASGDFNPIHVDREYAAGDRIRQHHRPRDDGRRRRLGGHGRRLRKALGRGRAAEAPVQGAGLPGRHGDDVRRGENGPGTMANCPRSSARWACAARPARSRSPARPP